VYHDCHHAHSFCQGSQALCHCQYDQTEKPINIEEMILLMKTITNIAMRLQCGSLGSVVREVAPRPFSGALGFSFCTFLWACWGIASETAAVFPVVTLLVECRGGISVKWGQE
jgi:hypothetical protein